MPALPYDPGLMPVGCGLRSSIDLWSRSRRQGKSRRLGARAKLGVGTMHEAPDDHGSENASGSPPGSEVAASFFDLFGTGALLLLFTGCLLLYSLFQGALWGGRPGAAVWGLALAPVVGILVPIALVIRSLRRPIRAELWLFPLDGRQALGVVLAILGTVPLDYALSAANLRFVTPDTEALQLQQ